MLLHTTYISFWEHMSFLKKEEANSWRSGLLTAVRYDNLMEFDPIKFVVYKQCTIQCQLFGDGGVSIRAFALIL